MKITSQEILARWNRVRQARDAKGWTNKELAQTARVSPATLRRYLTRTPHGGKVLAAVENALALEPYVRPALVMSQAQPAQPPLFPAIAPNTTEATRAVMLAELNEARRARVLAHIENELQRKRYEITVQIAQSVGLEVPALDLPTL